VLVTPASVVQCMRASHGVTSPVARTDRIHRGPSGVGGAERLYTSPFRQSQGLGENPNRDRRVEATAFSSIHCLARQICRRCQRGRRSEVPGIDRV